jgi:hypothetical protein
MSVPTESADPLRNQHAAEDGHAVIAEGASGLAESARTASMSNPPAGHARDDDKTEPTGPPTTSVMGSTDDESGRPGSNRHHQLGRDANTDSREPE